jgi:hypothetical protein
VEGEDGFPKSSRFNLLGNCVEEVSFPCWVVQQVTNREGDVGIVVLVVLLEDDIASGGVEVPICCGWWLHSSVCKVR